VVSDAAVRDGVELEVWNALAGIHDPEIPPLAITELGIVERVDVAPEHVEVTLLPTFAGCPALDVIREDVTAAVGRVSGAREVKVKFVYFPPWTSNRITPAGREALKRYGMIVADNGSSWFISGSTDSRWNDGDLNQLKLVPGSAFGPSGEGHVRACYATAYEDLEEALVRIERFLQSL